MKASRRKLEQPHPQLRKAPTGIKGLDEITLGGLPQSRPTLVCGGAGCGKSLLAVTFLVKGVTECDEPGVLMAFEERAEDIAANVASLGYDVPGLMANGKLVIDAVRVEPSEIEESGEYDLEGLFVRLDHAIKSVGAKRVVLDTVEALFVGLANEAILRAELRRLFEWLKEQGVTAIITGERGDGRFTRHGLEEYVSDCVILLDNRVHEQIVTRRLRVVKYRGSAHGTNEYPFLIDDRGISVLPITGAGLGHKTSDQVVPTGLPDLDAMLGVGGFYRGSSIMFSGSAGTGKTILAAQCASAACARGERCLYFSFEESPEQIMRNVRSVGIDLAKYVHAGLLRLESARPSLYGFEMHLARMNREIEAFKPTTVVADPLSAFRGTEFEVHAAMLRLVDILKTKGITALFTRLTTARELVGGLEHGISSLIDTWIDLIAIEENGERNRGLYVIKSRGMGHSNQIREYVLTDHGPKLVQPYLGPAGVLTGSARVAQEARESAETLLRAQEMERRRRELKRKREATERQIAELRAALRAEEEDVSKLEGQDLARDQVFLQAKAALATRRGAVNDRTP
jgi:circadian clock protein KaiC